MKPNTVGSYGGWLDRLQSGGPGALSLRRGRWPSLAGWRRVARARVLRDMACPATGPAPKVRVTALEQCDGLHIEHLTWRLPFGPPTEALFLKPAGARGRLPAVLALHCHGGIKALGWRKIARGRSPGPAHLMAHRPGYYDGTFWANELAHRGYAVLAHDVFPFASRGVRVRDVIHRVQAGAPAQEPRTAAAVGRYNQWAGGHEHVMAKALFNAGTTWPGVVFAEDRVALDLLCARKDVDPRRVGCGGLSGGGLRTVLLAGLDDRIRAAVCAGFMTTWRDLATAKCWTHAWMSHIPLLPAVLDFPEILGLRAPLPALVLSTRQDDLFTLGEMRRADRMLREIWRKAGAPHAYRTTFRPGPHQFNRPMQRQAFAFFDRWLGRKTSPT